MPLSLSVVSQRHPDRHSVLTKRHAGITICKFRVNCPTSDGPHTLHANKSPSLCWRADGASRSLARVNATLPTKVLGKTGLQVTTLGVGCAWLGQRADGSV